MSSKEIGSILREIRTSRDMDVAHVSNVLISQGFKASVKTVYSWENGNSQPTPDALLALCTLYGISDVLSTFGYKKEAAPRESEELSESEYLLIKGFRAALPGDQQTLLHIVERFSQAANPIPQARSDSELAEIAQEFVREQARLQSKDSAAENK